MFSTNEEISNCDFSSIKTYVDAMDMIKRYNLDITLHMERVITRNYLDEITNSELCFYLIEKTIIGSEIKLYYGHWYSSIYPEGVKKGFGDYKSYSFVKLIFTETNNSFQNMDLYNAVDEVCLALCEYIKNSLSKTEKKEFKLF